MNYSSKNLAFSLSAMVSDATACLPPLTRPEDSDMLHFALEAAADAFWRMYVSGLSQKAKDAFVEFLENRSDEQFIEWTRKYANFEQDPLAEKIATAILEDLSKKLPQYLTEMYQESIEEGSPNNISNLATSA